MSHLRLNVIFSFTHFHWYESLIKEETKTQTVKYKFFKILENIITNCTNITKLT